MKLSLLILALPALILFSCQKKEGSNAITHDMKVYRQCKDMGDYAGAAYAMQSILARDSSHTNYYDSLAVLYFESSRYPQAVEAARRLLQTQPSNIRMLEVAARSNQFAGRSDLSINYYIKLRNVDKKPEYDYQLALAYYNTNGYPQAEGYANGLINSPDKTIDSLKVVVTDPSGAVPNQSISLKAATYNILGSTMYREGKKQEAKEYFKKALDFQPDFTLAKDNFSIVSKEIK